MEQQPFYLLPHGPHKIHTLPTEAPKVVPLEKCYPGQIAPYCPLCYASGTKLKSGRTHIILEQAKEWIVMAGMPLIIILLDLLTSGLTNHLRNYATNNGQNVMGGFSYQCKIFQ